MTPAQIRAIRKKLGLTQLAWGRGLGYSDSKSTKHRICAMETGRLNIPPRVAQLAELYDRLGADAIQGRRNTIPK
jgi:transcriptional regulator with XRE-family HTH domain